MITFLMVIENDEDRNKLEELYNLWHRDMFVVAYSILKDFHEAQDIVQDAIIRLSVNLEKIIDLKCKKTRSYLVIIVRNLSFNAYNKRNGIQLVEPAELERMLINENEMLEDFVIKLDTHMSIQNYLGKLYEPYSDILTLRFYYELEIREISEMIGITENNVSVRIHRALAALKSMIMEEGNDYEQTI